MPISRNSFVSQLEQLIHRVDDPQEFNKVAAFCIEEYLAQSTAETEYKLMFWANQKIDTFTNEVIAADPITKVIFNLQQHSIVSVHPHEPRTTETITIPRVRGLFKAELNYDVGLVVLSANSEQFPDGEGAHFIPPTLEYGISSHRHFTGTQAGK